MRDKFKEVVDSYVDGNMDIAKMISDSPRQIIRLNQVICGLGISFVVNGQPTLDILKICLMIGTFAIGYWLSKFIEQSIVFGAVFFRKETKDGWDKCRQIIAGLSIVVPTFLASVFLSDSFFSSIVQMTHSTNTLAMPLSFVLGTLLPTVQILQQMYKKHTEDIVKESTNAQEMHAHMYDRKRENLIAGMRLESVERIAADAESLSTIDGQVKEGLFREIAHVGQNDAVYENVQGQKTIITEVKSENVQTEQCPIVQCNEENVQLDKNVKCPDVSDENNQITFVGKNVQDKKSRNLSLVQFTNTQEVKMSKKTNGLLEEMSSMDNDEFQKLMSNRQMRIDLSTKFGVSEKTVSRKIVEIEKRRA